MNIHEAAKSGKPFYNPDMIGAWLIVNSCLIHRDNISDFSDMEFIKNNCLSSKSDKDLYWMDTQDLLRDDWQLAEV